MNASTKTPIVDPAKYTGAMPFTQELAAHFVIEMRKTNRAGEYGFRVRCLADETGDTRLIQAAIQYADDHALGVQGVRGERMGLGGDSSAAAGGYTQTQLDALMRVREVVQALGPVASAMLRDMVIDCVTARELARRWKIDDKTAAKRGTVALLALADWYERPKGARKEKP